MGTARSRQAPAPRGRLELGRARHLQAVAQQEGAQAPATSCRRHHRQRQRAGSVEAGPGGSSAVRGGSWREAAAAERGGAVPGAPADAQAAAAVVCAEQALGQRLNLGCWVADF